MERVSEDEEAAAEDAKAEAEVEMRNNQNIFMTNLK